MAGIKFEVTMTDNSTMTVNASMTDADVARLLTAMASKYVAPEGQEPTGEWLTRKWIEEVIVDALNYTKSYEANLAAQAAVAQVELIPVTIE